MRNVLLLLPTVALLALGACESTRIQVNDPPPGEDGGLLLPDFGPVPLPDIVDMSAADAETGAPPDVGRGEPELPDPDLKGDPPDLSTTEDVEELPDTGFPHEVDITDPQNPQGFPVQYDTSQIELVEEGTFKIVGVDFSGRFYRNKAYHCGKSGHFTFLVIEQQVSAGQKRGLWVFMHGGGVGYYDASGKYHGGEGANNEEPGGKLLAELSEHVMDEDDGDFKQTLILKRAQDGYRFLATSMCDHDLHSGMGTPYPNNPNWPGTPDTVDGLLATMAAIDFTAHGNGKLPGYPTGMVFVHGTSAGSAGAYSVSHAFARNGIKLNGALLDAYVISERTAAVMGKGCTPSEDSDSNFEAQGVIDKVGAFVTDSPLFLENNLSSEFSIPYMDMISTGDEYCCGDHPVMPEVAAAGYDNNCRYVHGLVKEAVDGLGPGSLHKVLIAEAMGQHALSKVQGPHQEILEEWYQGIVATNPPPPWP